MADEPSGGRPYCTPEAVKWALLAQTANAVRSYPARNSPAVPVQTSIPISTSSCTQASPQC